MLSALEVSSFGVGETAHAAAAARLRLLGIGRPAASSLPRPPPVPLTGRVAKQLK